MCRLLAYKGSPIVMDQLLYQPKNSLINQSFAAQEIEEPLNGDGFGIGWYSPQLSPNPAVFVSMSPAWSNRNLRSLAPRIESTCFFAHVRAASFGDTSESNCHPFHYKEFLMMHNGNIGGFDLFKRQLRRGLSDKIYSWIKGQTDSEHFFAIFLEGMEKLGPNYTVIDMQQQVLVALQQVQDWKKELGVTEDETYLNTVISNGKFMVGTRYYSGTDREPLSLYVSEGSRYVCEDGVCHMLPMDPKNHAILIVSEKLTEVAPDFKKIPANHFVRVDENSKVQFEAIKLRA
jgi:glutamine amidotransferase